MAWDVSCLPSRRREECEREGTVVALCESSSDVNTCTRMRALDNCQICRFVLRLPPLYIRRRKRNRRSDMQDKHRLRVNNKMATSNARPATTQRARRDIQTEKEMKSEIGDRFDLVFVDHLLFDEVCCRIVLGSWSQRLEDGNGRGL